MIMIWRSCASRLQLTRVPSVTAIRKARYWPSSIAGAWSCWTKQSFSANVSTRRDRRSSHRDLVNTGATGITGPRRWLSDPLADARDFRRWT
jgi:hypothetical protein